MRMPAFGIPTHSEFRRRLEVMQSKLSLCLVLAAFGAAGQSFEVASVRPSAAMTSEAKRDIGMRVDGAQVDISMMSLADLVRQAYGLKAPQFSGASWMSSERYDIHAKLPAGSTQEQVPVMLQSLLTERFKLAFHRESRELQVYALMVGKGGLKLKEAATSQSRIQPDKKWVMAGSSMRLERDMTMQALCDLLGGLVDRPLIDVTGLTAAYHVTLDIPMDELKRAKMSAEGNRGGGESASEPPGSPAMFSSLRDSGLTVEGRKMSMDVLVVDHAERVPTEN
jgi:uncharacterized protein (TIGR03435 family)